MPTRLKNPIGKSKTQPQIYATVSEWDGVLHKDNLGPSLCKIQEMRKHPTISLARQLIIAPVLAAKWVYTAESEAPEGAKEFIAKQLAPFRMNLLRTTFQGYIDYGWQAYEKVFKIDRKGMIGLSKLKPLLQELTEILVDPKTGAYKGLKQYAYANTVYREVTLSVPESLLVSLDVDGTQWYGNSLFKATEGAYEQYETCRRGADRYDRKMAGSHWIVHYPPGASDYNGQEEVSNDDIAQEILNKLESSGRIAVPKVVEAFIDELKDGNSAWTIELLSDSSNAASSFIERLKYLDALLVRTFGVPERAVLEGSFGTKAEADSHASAAVINMDMRHRLAVVTYNQHIVDHLLRINYGEEYEGTVFIDPAPLENSQRKMLSTIYDRILQSPEAGAEEVWKIDTESLKAELGIPYTDELDETIRSIRDVLYEEGSGNSVRKTQREPMGGSG